MKLLIISACLLLLFNSFDSKSQARYCLVIHGGAGDFNSKNFDAELTKSYYQFFDYLLSYGDSLLSLGFFAIDVAELCARKLEDNPLFNAGKGAVVNSKGEFELDASIMNGQNLSAGSVSGVRIVKNPVSLARLVMDSTFHVMLVGQGAEEFAIHMQVDIVDKSYFETPHILEKYKKIKESKNGTIGVVVLDMYGNLAAATSTGGMMMKKFGRVGDSPIIGAGTYADNNFAAISCTGHGEYFIRTLAAYNVIALMKYGNRTLEQATAETLLNIQELGGYGGLIAVDKFGNISITYNTKSMFRAYVKSNGEKVILF